MYVSYLIKTRSEVVSMLRMTLSRLTSQIAVTARIRALYGDFSGRSDTRFRPCCIDNHYDLGISLRVRDADDV